MNVLKLSMSLLLVSCLCTLHAQQDTVDMMDGVRYIVLEKGDGAQPLEGQEVCFHVTAMQADETPIFSSHGLGFPFYELIDKEKDARMAMGMMAMHVGGTHRILVPKEALSEDDQLRQLPTDMIIFEMELLSVGAPKVDAAQVIAETLEAEGLAAAEAKFAALQVDESGEIDFREGPLNILGYRLMEKGQLEEAVAVFRMNVTAHPKSHNVYDSLGDGYLALAKAQYEQVLAINPEVQYTKDKLAKF